MRLQSFTLSVSSPSSIDSNHMSGQSALLIGATGATGKHVLRELLTSPHFTRVGEMGRRITAKEQLPRGSQGKLEQKVINFEKLEDAELQKGKWDVVFITMGTSIKAAGSPQNFERFDREFVVNAAKAARTDDANQRLIYLSANYSNPDASALYLRSKGLTEQALAALGYGDMIVFRPVFLRNAERAGFRPVEAILSPITAVLSWLSSSFTVDVRALARSIRIAGELGTPGLPSVASPTKRALGGNAFTTISNKGSVLLAKQDL